MANATGAFGLRPVRRADGAPWTGAVESCYIASGYATALFIGDPVILSDEADDKDATGYMYSVEKAGVADGSIIFGVIVGFEPLVTDLTKQYNPASTERVAKVVRADGTIFQIRGDGGGTVTSAFPGLNAIMIQTAAGSTATGLSGIHLDEGSGTAPSANQSNPLYILRMVNKPDNVLGDNVIYEVEINTPYNATGRTLGVAGS
jgi:hypothetical protein